MACSLRKETVDLTKRKQRPSGRVMDRLLPRRPERIPRSASSDSEWLLEGPPSRPSTAPGPFWTRTLGSVSPARTPTNPCPLTPGHSLPPASGPLSLLHFDTSSAAQLPLWKKNWKSGTDGRFVLDPAASSVILGQPRDSTGLPSGSRCDAHALLIVADFSGTIRQRRGRKGDLAVSL